MPKTILGEPVDEEKWKKAKAQAAKAGHTEDWPYIVGIYEQMAGLKSKGDRVGLEELPKSRRRLILGV